MPAMNAPLTLAILIMAPGPIQFERHDIDSFPGGYQVATADVNGNGLPDVIALSTSADRVDWYQNPDWKRRPIARTSRNIDLAVRDIDGDGRLEIALASGFHFSDSTRGGQIHLLKRPDNLDELWPMQPVAVDPVVHRLSWGDLDGDGRLELVHAPIFGPGSDTFRSPKPSHLWAFRPPPESQTAGWDIWRIDETLTVLHGLYVADLDGDGKDEILTASFEGVFRFDFDGHSLGWRKTLITTGAAPVDDKPGVSRGSSEVAPGKLGPDRPFLAAIEPWHGHQVVVYTPGHDVDHAWRRLVLDESLNEGHALVVADFDGDGADEIVVGWRGAGGGLVLFDPIDETGRRFNKTVLDTGIPVECAVAADLNLNGRLDLVVIAGRTNNLTWYENRR